MLHKLRSRTGYGHSVYNRALKLFPHGNRLKADFKAPISPDITTNDLPPMPVPILRFIMETAADFTAVSAALTAAATLKNSMTPTASPLFGSDTELIPFITSGMHVWYYRTVNTIMF